MGAEAHDEMNEEIEEVNSDILPIRIGDYVILRGLNVDGFLSGEGILEDGVFLSTNPPRFDDCVFQVCLANQYSAAKELLNFKEQIQIGNFEMGDDMEASRDGGADLVVGNDDDDEEAEDTISKEKKFLAALERSKMNEAAMNKRQMEANIGNQLKFGQTIQLLHRKSQKYLTVDSMVVASHERENLRVYLSDEGNALSWFNLKPWFKIDRENADMESNAAVYLQVAERSQEQIHSSEVTLTKNSKDREVNCSLDRSGWRVQVYSEYHASDTSDLFAGEIVRLFDPEKLTYLRLIEETGKPRVDAFLEVNSGVEVNSNYLWMLERHRNPSAGGKIAYGQFTYRLRHLNSGKYLCCRSADRWKSSRRMIQSIMALKTGATQGFNDAPEEYVFASMTSGRSTPCALTLNPAQMHMAMRSGGMGSPIIYISDQSAVTIRCNQRWLHRGGRFGNTEIFHTEAKATQKDTLALVIQKFSAPDAVMTDIMVGVAALPFLRKYLAVVHKHHNHADLWTPSAYPQFIKVVRQLVNFLSQMSLAESTDFDLIEEKLQTLKVDEIRFRQQLLREQGVLNTVLAVMEALVNERTTKIAESATLQNTNKRRTRSASDFHALKQEVAEASCWLLRLAILDNPTSQMFIADHLATLIAYVPLDGNAGLATKCITHMLSTNVELQETKVKDSDIEHFITMIRSSQMNAAYLDLLRSVCSCQGRGIDGNQCRVVELWLQNSADLNMRLAVDTTRPYKPAKSVSWFGDIDTSKAGDMMGGQILVDGVPHLLLDWTTDTIELQPHVAFKATGSKGVSIAQAFEFTTDRVRLRLQKYLISQLYLGAEICLDRNYLAMQILEEQLPFDFCLAILKDRSMPSTLKAAITRIVACVYVDADPQTIIRIPRLSHAYADVDTVKGYTLPSVDDSERSKFLLLQDLISENLNDLSKSGWDQYTRQQMSLLLKLVQFRFYNTTEQFHSLVRPLVQSLDCRGQDPEADAALMMQRPSMILSSTGSRNSMIPGSSPYLLQLGSPKSDARIAPADAMGETAFGEKAKATALAVVPKTPRQRAAFKAHKAKASKAYDVLDSVLMLTFILSLVFVGIILSLMDMAGDVSDSNKGIKAFEYTASGIFFFELTIRMYCFTYKFGDGEASLLYRRFILDLYNVVDVLVVLIDLVMYSYDLASSSADAGETQTFAKAGRVLRLARLSRIFKAARLINKINEDVVEEEEPEWEIPRRYVKTTTRQLQTMLQMIRVLAELSLLSRDFTLGTTITELKKRLAESGEGAASQLQGSPGTKADDDDDEAGESWSTRLFSKCIVKGDELSLSESGASFDEVFLDLCLYAHADLVQAALNVLMIHHSHRQFLLADLSGTQLISDDSEAADFRRLRGELAELQSAAEKHELWGELESEEDHAMNHRTKEILRSLSAACYTRHRKPEFYSAYSPHRKYQDMIRNLGGFETAMTVLGLHASIADTEDEDVAANTTEILRLCNNFLSWFIASNIENQQLAYEEMDFWMETLDDDINSGHVAAAIMKGNSELIRQVPIKIINFLAEQIIKNGHRVEYLVILEAMVFLEDFEGDNNTEVQFTILSELARSGRADRTMYLCADRRGDDYKKRIDFMEEAKTGIMNLGQEPMQDVTPWSDWSHLSHTLAYHCKLLEVLAGCAYGRINITTVETKLQNMLNPEACLWALLDPTTSHDVAAPLAAYFFHVVVEVEIAVPGLGQNLLMWEFLERIPKQLNAAASILAQPSEMMACADGAIGVKSRQQLQYTWFCIRIFTIFFKNYYSVALRQECADELRTSPTAIKYFESLSKRSAAVGPGDDEDLVEVPPTTDLLPVDLPEAASQGATDTADDDGSYLDPSIASLEDDNSMVLSLDLESEEEEDLDKMAEDEEVHWIDLLIEELHGHAQRLLEKHQGVLYAKDQLVLIEGVTALRSVSKFQNVSELPAVEPDEEEETSDTQQHLEDFVGQLTESEGLANQIIDDRTKIVDVIEALPKIRDTDIEADLRFEPLIGKLVNHARSRLLDEGPSKKLDPECTKTTIWIIQLFRRMIEKKWGMTIDERDEDGGEEQDEASAPVIQVLNKYGVTTLCIDVIAVGVDGLLVLEAIKCCVAMLFKEGGNLLVQSTIHKHLMASNSELFFREMQLQISKMRRFYEFEDIPPCEEDDDPTVPENIIVLRFLQLMSEGHYEPNQDVVRDQPNNLRSINLLDDFVGLLNICSQRPSRSASATADAVTATILEVIQGPCVKNQEYFAINSELIEIMNRVLRAPVTGDCDAEEEDNVKKTVLEIFEGLTEGQGKNSVVFDRILSVIDLDVIQVMVQALPAEIEEGGVPQMTEIQVEGLVLLQMFMDYNPALANEIKLPRRIRNQMGKDVVSVEVVWNGKLQRRFFPAPPICTHIAEATKQRLVEDVDRTSQDAKLQDFVYRAKDIYREVQHQQWLSDCEWRGINLAQVFSRRNQEGVTWLAFVCALTINILFLFTYEHKQGWISRMAEDDFQTRFNVAPGDVIRDSDIYFGKHDAIISPIVLIMNILNIMLSFFTLILFIVVRCPVKYQKLMEETNPPWWRALIMTATDVMTLYYLGYTIIAVISMSIESAMHPFLLLDVIVKESTTRDVVKAVVHPIKQLSAAMVLGVFVIYIFAMITFKNFASDFRYDGGLDDDALTLEEAKYMNDDCRTLWGCFKVSANYGMRLSGGTGDIMTHTLEGQRLILDLLYFLIVLVVLLNIIFGIIIDTFSDLRTKKLERIRDTTDKCFICGIDGFTFDQASSEPGSAFRRHFKNDHYMWNYLSFIIFIWEQDRDDDDGLELYVRRMLEKGETIWFPSGKALCLQTDEELEETTSEHIDRVKGTLEAALAELGTKQLATINELSTTLNSAVQKVHDLILHRGRREAQLGDDASISSRNFLDLGRPSTSHA